MEEIREVDDPRVGKRKGYFFGGLILGFTIAFFLMAGLGIVLYQTYLSKTNKNDSESAFDQASIDKLQLLEEAVQEFYYKTDVEGKDLVNGAYKGMIESIGDPYSTYYTPEELDEIMEQSTGVYYGIGAVIERDKESGLPKVNSVLPESPAMEVGLRQGDLIYKVEEEEMYDLDLTTVVAKIKGAEGSTVHITIFREGEEDELEFQVERRKLDNPTVKSEMYEDGIAYIQIMEFDDITVEQFEEALLASKDSGMESLIIDLRANPGGNLSAVVDIARMILPEGLIVYTEDRDGVRQEYNCNGKQELNVPIVVLINGYSASASEILAGAIKDYHKGTLIGTTTFGKGIVQQILPLGDGSAVKLTVSDYYTPSGKNIHGIGIEPDIEYEFDAEAYYGEEQFDNQLERAKEYLKTGK